MMTTKLPDHVAGVFKYLTDPSEKADEDLVLGWFRYAFGNAFTRQADANRADGYVPGHLVLELKGNSRDWLSGLCQALAQRDLDFSLAVVVARNFIGVWHVDDVNELRVEALSQSGPPHHVGKMLASRHRRQRGEILLMASWNLRPELVGPLFGNDGARTAALKELEEVLKSRKRIRLRITPRNFLPILEQMAEFFEPPVKAVRAFYTMVFGWQEKSALLPSAKDPTTATLEGETITCIKPGCGPRLKALVERYVVRPEEGQTYDEFFAQYDRALDAVDPQFRRRHGIYFTDIDLSRFAMWLVKSLLGDVGENYLVIDPACGSGNLVTNWKSPLQLRHKVVSELDPELLFAVERRMKGDAWHQGKFTVVPKAAENRGLNFLDKSADEYLDVLREYLNEKGMKPERPIAFLCNPPYRNDDDQSVDGITYEVDPSVVELVGNDAAKERYCCFLAQMKLLSKAAEESGLPGKSLLLLFTKAAWLERRDVFTRIRREILGSFKDVGGVIVNGKEFFDVAAFPVAFTVWEYEGEASRLDWERTIPVIDLTWVKRVQLSAIEWDTPAGVQSTCAAIMGDARSRTVPLGLERQKMREWVNLSRYNFYRGRRQSEGEETSTGGLPRGDHRRNNKTAYGEEEGENVGFMDDLTPCRIPRSSGGAPWFRLDGPLMDCRKGRCFSGPPDQKGFSPSDDSSRDKLFLWYAIQRTLAVHGYPMWADALEFWPPVIPDSERIHVQQLCFALALAENECIVTRFQANNPKPGARELYVRNPMCPLEEDSYWKLHLASVFSDQDVTSASRLVRAVTELYARWGQLFIHQPELPAPFTAAYYVGDGFLTRSSGITQIRDYLSCTHDQPEIQEAFEAVQVVLKAVKAEFYDFLTASTGLDYFGTQNDVSREPFSARTSFEITQQRRLALASYLVNRLNTEQHFGRTKLAKLFYLADARLELDLRTDYARHAAGPLDARSLYDERVGVEAVAQRHDYFSHFRLEREGFVEMVRYQPGPNIHHGVSDAQRLFSDKAEELNRVISLLEHADTNQCEIVATLFACWNDLLLARKSVVDNAIISEFRERWHVKKERFSESRLKKAIRWMRDHDVVPLGRGKKTTRPAKTDLPS